MSQPKQYEAATIEEALRAVAIDLGDDIEILSAVKERRGGVLGFFAKERFVVTAQQPTPEAVDEDSAAAFGELLLSLTDGVEDTWEGTTPIATPPATGQPPVDHTPAHPPAAEVPAKSVIDLRSGKRTVRTEPAVAPANAFSFGSERPSQLRRRIRATELADPNSETVVNPTQQMDHADIDLDAVDPASAAVLAVAGPLHGLGDTAPNWSLSSLRNLGLPVLLLETVQEFDPASDIEWMHAIAIAIDRMWPEDTDSTPVSWVVGEGRAAAVELIRGIPFGRLPAAIMLPGRQVRATPDELAFALRECVR